jgi:hypothetical protein
VLLPLPNLVRIDAVQHVDIGSPQFPEPLRFSLVISIELINFLDQLHRHLILIAQPSLLVLLVRKYQYFILEF